jgi:hypothetical protein
MSKRPRAVSGERARIPLDAPGIGLLLALIDLRGASSAGATGPAPQAPVDRRRGPQRAPRD